MLLSVIVPVYNTQPYLQDCLDALMHQGLDEADYEVICVNDGSTDNSLQVLRAYAEKYKNIVVIDCENGGVSAARNAGLRAVRGKYTAFCDSDDCIRSGSLGEILHFMVQNGLQAVIMERFQSVSEDYHYEPEEAPQTDITVLPHSEYSARNVCSFILETKIWKDNHIWFYNGMQYGEDTLFAGVAYTHIALCGAKLGILHTPVYLYRNRKDSAMHSVCREKHFSDMQAIAVTYASLLKNGIVLESVQRNLQKRVGAAVSAMLYDNLKCGMYSPKTLFAMLREKDLYPFYTQWWAVKEAKSFKLKCANFWKYTFKSPMLYRLYFAVLYRK